MNVKICDNAMGNVSLEEIGARKFERLFYYVQDNDNSDKTELVEITPQNLFDLIINTDELHFKETLQICETLSEVYKPYIKGRNLENKEISFEDAIYDYRKQNPQLGGQISSCLDKLGVSKRLVDEKGGVLREDFQQSNDAMPQSIYLEGVTRDEQTNEYKISYLEMNDRNVVYLLTNTQDTQKLATLVDTIIDYKLQPIISTDYFKSQIDKIEESISLLKNETIIQGVGGVLNQGIKDEVSTRELVEKIKVIAGELNVALSKEVVPEQNSGSSDNPTFEEYNNQVIADESFLGSQGVGGETPLQEGNDGIGDLNENIENSDEFQFKVENPKVEQKPKIRKTREEVERDLKYKNLRDVFFEMVSADEGRFKDVDPQIIQSIKNTLSIMSDDHGAMITNTTSGNSMNIKLFLRNTFAGDNAMVDDAISHLAIKDAETAKIIEDFKVARVCLDGLFVGDVLSKTQSADRQGFKSCVDSVLLDFSSSNPNALRKNFEDFESEEFYQKKIESQFNYSFASEILGELVGTEYAHYKTYDDMYQKMVGKMLEGQNLLQNTELSIN